MREWSDANEFNPMNSTAKGLTYYRHMRQILDWMNGKGELPGPVEASLDPSAVCQQDCYYCSSNRYRGAEQGIKRWGLDYMEDLLCELAQRRVKGFCWGGREATLNLRLADATRLGVSLGMEAAIVTNGVYLPENLLEALMLCKWVGVSVDTTNPEIYKRVRGTDDCEAVWSNIYRLCERKKSTVVGVRALVLPETIGTLYDVCRRARQYGANFVHIRPADLERADLAMPQPELDLEAVADTFHRCHELETPGFGVFTVTHKFDDKLKAAHKFFRCLASPLVEQVCTDKKRYLCVDHRMDSRFEIKGEWGGSRHRELIMSVDPAKECSRCTWAKYNEIMESVVEGDSIHVNFP